MQGYSEFIKKLQEIKAMGYIKTHRAGNTGIGKTLEDLLGIEENNIPGPNGHLVELKSGRKESVSMVSLFTKSPLPKSANSELLQKFGYPTQKSEKELHCTLKSNKVNCLKGSPTFKIGFKEDSLELQDKKGKMLCYWDKETLRERFESKYPGSLLYVKANSKGKGAKEEFWFNEAWLLWEFSFENFIDLLKDGTICIDLRIGSYSNGKSHDHGTGFRILPSRLDMCFSNRVSVI
jgi:hypothetical protein